MLTNITSAETTMIRLQFATICGLIVACSGTAQAQYLAERLVPPQQVTLPAVPMSGKPVEPQVIGAEKPRLHLWGLPFAPFPGTPTGLESEKRPVNWYRPILDLPMLASDLDPARPAFPLQPISSRTYLAAPDPMQPSSLARFTPFPQPPVLPGDDPTEQAAFPLISFNTLPSTPNSVPLLRLGVPDPFETFNTIRLKSPPSDSDDPATSLDRPPLAKFPMIEPAK
jgi:hypothetical protein